MTVKCEIHFCGNKADVVRTWNDKGHFISICNEHHGSLTDAQLAEAFPHGNVNTILATAVNNMPKGTALIVQSSLKKLIKTFRIRTVDEVAQSA